MTLILDLPNHLEARLRQEAARVGIAPAEYVQRVVAERLAAPSTDAASVSDLFSRWLVEDGPIDASDVAKHQADFEQFKAALNKNRLESDGPHARKPFP